MRYASDNFAYWLEVRASRDAEREAVVELDRRTTYDVLARNAARVSGALWSAGIRPRDRVAVSLKNRVEFLEVLFGCARIGAVFVPLNYRLAAEQVAYALEDSGSTLVVTQAVTDATVREALGALTRQPELVCVDGEGATYAPWRDAAEPRDCELVDPSHPLSIIYTSGTTGPPKGALLTHEGAMTNIHNYLFEWDLRRDDVTIVVNPIFHVVLYILCVPLLYKGGRVILMEDFDAATALHLAQVEGVTVWFAIPTAWQMIFDVPEFASWDRRGLRFIGSGGAACPGPLMTRIEELGIPYRQGYGLSETTSSATTMVPEAQATHRGSIGRPFLFVEARIVTDDGEVTESGEVGEIQLRGRNICAGYWNKPEESASTFDGEGWFRTGDVGRHDEQGYIWIVDRKKDIIISGGENIGSIEIEQVILGYPDVAQVSVIGVPHPRWGETPCAVVVRQPETDVSAEQIIAYCRERLAHFKCPTQVVFLDELPVTANGKVVKATLRQVVASGVK
ncbi:MAG: class I adenylate-forming enzyme family protein [Acidimicrobiales bacterium]